MSGFVLGKRSKAKLYGDDEHPGVHPAVAELVVKALGYSTVDFGITDGVRTEAEQQAMHRDGKSELDGVNKLSDHQRRLAVDIYPVVHLDGKRVNMYDIEDPFVVTQWLEVYRALMRASFKLGLVLEFGLGYNIGGGRDWPHVSIKGRVPADYSGMAS